MATCLMLGLVVTSEAQEGAGMGLEARTGLGHSGLWPFKAGLEVTSATCALCPTLP